MQLRILADKNLHTLEGIKLYQTVRRREVLSLKKKGRMGKKKENDVTIRGEFLPGTHLVSYFHFLRQMISSLLFLLTEKLCAYHLSVANTSSFPSNFPPYQFVQDGMMFPRVEETKRFSIRHKFSEAHHCSRICFIRTYMREYVFQFGQR